MIKFLIIPRESAERMYLGGPHRYGLSKLVNEYRDERIARVQKLHEMLNGVEGRVKELKVLIRKGK